jgi:hypothetical protein
MGRRLSGSSALPAPRPGVSGPAPRRRRPVIPEPRATPWEIEPTALNGSPVRAVSSRSDKRALPGPGNGCRRPHRCATPGPRKPLTPPLQGSIFHNADRVLGRCPRLWDDVAPTARAGDGRPCRCAAVKFRVRRRSRVRSQEAGGRNGEPERGTPPGGLWHNGSGVGGLGRIGATGRSCRRMAERRAPSAPVDAVGRV